MSEPTIYVHEGRLVFGLDNKEVEIDTRRLFVDGPITFSRLRLMLQPALITLGVEPEQVVLFTGPIA